MYDPLEKNLLLPSCFAKDFKEESFASLLGILVYWTDWGYFGEESFASLLRLL